MTPTTIDTRPVPPRAEGMQGVPGFHFASTGHSGRSADLSLAALLREPSVNAKGLDARFGYLRDTRRAMDET
jgi:hypothetical protein